MAQQKSTATGALLPPQARNAGRTLRGLVNAALLSVTVAGCGVSLPDRSFEALEQKFFSKVDADGNHYLSNEEIARAAITCGYDGFMRGNLEMMLQNRHTAGETITAEEQGRNTYMPETKITIFVPYTLAERCLDKL